MSKFEESNFYKALQDFFINADKKTFLQFLAEFYNRTEGIIDKDNIQDDLIKELRELYLEFNEKGIDENIVREKVNYFLENSVKIKDVIKKLDHIEIQKATKEEVETERKRIDNLTKLGEGSTTGDAELIDIRVGIDGTTYENAGEAVRKQFKELDYLKEYSTIVEKNKITGEENRGKLYNFHDNTTFNESSSKYVKYDVSSLVDKKLLISGSTASVEGSAKFGLYAFYDNNNILINSFGNSYTSYSNVMVIVPNSAKYLIVNGGLSRFSGKTEANCNIIYYKNVKDILTSDLEILKTRLCNYEPLQAIEETGLVDFRTGNTFSNKGGKKYNIKNIDFLIVSGRVSTVSSASDYDLYAIYNENGNIIAQYGGMESNKDIKDIIVKIPINASYIILNTSDNANRCDKIVLDDNNKLKQDINKLKQDINSQGLMNIWKGKKIGVLGTSVAHGSNATKCYASECAKILGYNLKMFAAPGLAIHTKADGTALDYGSFTMSKEEYKSCTYVNIPDSVENFVPGQGYNDHYRTYENVFIEENKDIDLWIYAVAPNNINFATTDWDNFDRVNWRYKDGSSLADHRKTFLGALIFIMDKMYKLNPNARMILLLDSNFAYNDGLKCFNLVNYSYHIPIIDLWGNITTTPQSLKVIKSKNGTDDHPSTYAHEIMGRMLSGELLRIS